MDWKLIATWRFYLSCLVAASAATASNARGEDAPSPIRFAAEPHEGMLRPGVPAILVQRRGRPAEWRQLKELEDYYDDLEDFYKDRDPQLADYYERLEKYYEDVRKGRPAYLPPEAFPDEPVAFPPGIASVPPRFAMNRVAISQVALERAYRDLRGQLTRLNTGDTWLRYLALPLDEERGYTPLEVLQTVEAKEQLAEGMRRFDQIAVDPEYRVVARLPAFGRTRSALRSFTRWLDQQPTIAEPVLAGEEIPTPAPVEEEAPVDGPLLTPEPQ